MAWESVAGQELLSAGLVTGTASCQDSLVTPQLRRCHRADYLVTKGLSDEGWWEAGSGWHPCSCSGSRHPQPDLLGPEGALPQVQKDTMRPEV